MVPSNIVIVPRWLPLVEISEFSVFKASPLEDIPLMVPDSIVIESLPLIALFGALTSNVKFLISKSLVEAIPLL